jgi:cytochrome c oxidase assembly factor CtaG
MLASMLLAALLYLTGFRRLWRRSKAGRGELARRGRIFATGMAVLAGAALSPLHQLGGRSFTAHMVEHELIMLAAAPLLVWSQPLGVLLWAFPGQGRRALAGLARGRAAAGLWRALTDPWLATALQAAALWIWHLPSLFDRALRSEAWHAAQHLSFFAGALLFWTAMLGPRRNPWASAACLFVTSMVTGALGAFMALSQSPWYGPYAAMALAAFGLSPAEDQQFAGILMWVPGGLFHAVVAMMLLAPLLRSGQRQGSADA